ncbi:uncharacterized protein LOC133800074 [Humulus lupulus]|uniref:uncharacterized protein LOC133800074 n=1 Tax=Humulus lupulus TaxID=3486 RepID=UPI002B409207|nr:uncharacterized protein LOC133800074 [Humulus lupulus]
MEQIKEKQKGYEMLVKQEALIQKDGNNDFSISSGGMMCYKDRICVPDENKIKGSIMKEANSTPYYLHPGSNKMYNNPKTLYWWPGMKKDIAEYVAKCLSCQKVKSRYLPLMEFSYNNSYQSTIRIVPYAMLYGWKCMSPLHWDEVDEKQILGPRKVGEASEAVERITKKMLTAHSRPKSYADPHTPRNTVYLTFNNPNIFPKGG